MSNQEKEKETEKRVVKVSELLQSGAGQIAQAAQGAAQGGCMTEAIKAQIQNNQELYTTLSRSLLELHNDMRQLRQKADTTHQMSFKLQQFVNVYSQNVDSKLATLEERLNSLIELWNKAVDARNELERTDAVNNKGEENKESNE